MMPSCRNDAVVERRPFLPVVITELLPAEADATEFPREISDEEDLVRALREGGYRPVDFRDRLKGP